MEIETIKQKEKKISVKITKGSIWDGLKEKLEENISEKDVKDEDKKSSKKKLVVDIHVKREFRVVVKEEGWMCRIKSALGRSKVPEVNTDKEKRDMVERERSKVKASDKIKEQPKESQFRKRQDSILKKKTQDESESKNRITVSKDEEKEKDGTTVQKNQPITLNNPTKENHKSKDLSSTKNTRNISPSNEIEKQPLKDRGKVNVKNKVEENVEAESTVTNIETVNKEVVFTLDNVKTEERSRRNMATEKRSRSKPGTVKEKLKKKPDMPSVMNLNGGSNLAVSCLRSLKSSIISLKITENNKKEHKSKSKRRKRDSRRELDLENGGGDGGHKNEELTSSNVADGARALRNFQKGDEASDNSNISKNLKQDSKDIELCRTAGELKKVKKCKNSSQMCLSMTEAACLQSDTLGQTNGENVNSTSNENIEKGTHGTGCNSVTSSKKTNLSDQAYSSTSYSSSSGDNFVCTCGCMDAAHKNCTTLPSNSSNSSCTSIEYLRSYSGNLVMCASGKKNILADHIRYLSSCFEL